MKIWFDHQIFSIQRYGGVSRYFVELLRGLQHIEGVHAEVLAPAHVNGYLQPGDRLHPLSFALKRPERGLRYRPGWTAPVFRLAEWVGAPDLVHETHYMLGSEHLSARAKVVSTCHDMVFEKHPEWVGGSQDRARLKLRTFERANAIICISEHTRQDLIDIYPQFESKTFTVHHGVDHTPAAEHLPVRLPKPYLLFVGVRQGYKNFDSFVQALGRSKQLREHFHLVCFGGGAITARERQMAQDAGFPPERMHHLSGSDALLAYVYKQAATFVFPSLYEGFGMPLAEAMVQRCPIACSSASCLPEICEDAAAYFDPRDPDEMSHVIEATASMPHAYRAAAMAQRAGHFSWARCAAETNRVYQTVASA